MTAADIAVMRGAAEQVVRIQGRYASAGIGLAQAALAGARRLDPLRHYPRDDVIDHEGRAQFFYHAHPSSSVPEGEHGHFHLFRRLRGKGRFNHIAALSLDARGLPIRWFTTNRWVTGEQWADADTLIEALGRFRPRTSGRLAPVAEWLGAMTRLHADVIASLLHERDRLVGRLAKTRGLEELLEDRHHDVLTESPVSLGERLGALARRAPEPTRRDGHPTTR